MKFRVVYLFPLALVVSLLVTAAVLPNVVQAQELGCQQNNPDRLDCSSLEVSGICEADTAVFTIRNTGEAGEGDMRAPTQYRIIVNGVVVETGTIQIGGGTTTQIRYTGGGTVTLEADQQIGHPGGSQPQVTLNCVAPTSVPPTSTPVPPTSTPVPPTATPIPPTNTPVPPTATSTPTDTPIPPTATFTPTNTPVPPTTTFTPTQTPTLEPTVDPQGPLFDVYAYCEYDGASTFFILNYGAAMTVPVPYTVTGESGTLYDSSEILLGSYEYVTLTYYAFEPLTLDIGSGLVVRVLSCEETPVYELSAECLADGTIEFVITNTGIDMTEEAPYFIYDVDGNLVDSGTFFLLSSESITLTYSGYTALEIDAADGLIIGGTECALPTEEPPTPSPTVEPPTATNTPVPPTATFTATNTPVPPTATATPSWTPLPPTVTSTPTFTPTNTPILPTATFTAISTPTLAPTSTPSPTPSQSPGCQKNNKGRLDCSSLQVTGVCEGDVAVFTIRNTGEPGNGDMRAPTEYRLIQDGVVIESGSVLLAGGTFMEIRYDGGGTVRLEANQQIGHPGRSQPRATLTCSN